MRKPLALLAVLTSQACGEYSDPCPDGMCSVAHEADRIFGSLDGEDAFVSLFLTVSDEGDKLAVYDWNDPGRVRLYAETGEFIRFVGRQGYGPGEYQHPAHLFHRADDTWAVFDGRTPRLTILTENLSGVLATHRLPAFGAVFDVQQLPDDRMIVNGVLLTDDAAGLPLHLLNRNGELVRSFGASPATMGSWDTGAFYRTIAISRNGAVWVAHRDQYQVELWDTLGILLHTIRRQVDWFPNVPKRVFFGAAPENPPTPYVAGVWEDGEGRPWVYLCTPRSDWAAELVPTVEPATREYVFASTPHAMFDTRIEVLDPPTGQVEAAGLIPYGISSVSVSGRVFAPIVEMDVLRLQAWRATLQPQER